MDGFMKYDKDVGINWHLRFVTRSENSKGARVRTKEEIFKIGLMKGLF